MAKTEYKAIVSPLKFVVFSVLTFGMYPSYWAWRVWETVRSSKNQNYRIKSSVRGYFNIVSNFSLLPQLKELAEVKGYKSKADVRLVAGLYLLIRFLDGRVSLAVLCIGLIVEALILLPIVKMYNYYTEQTKGKYAPDKQNWWLIVALIVAFIVVALIYSNPNYWKE